MIDVVDCFLRPVVFVGAGFKPALFAQDVDRPMPYAVAAGICPAFLVPFGLKSGTSIGTDPE